MREAGFNPAFSYREQLSGAVLVHGRYSVWLCLCSGNALVPGVVAVGLNRSALVLRADRSPDYSVVGVRDCARDASLIDVKISPR